MDKSSVLVLANGYLSNLNTISWLCFVVALIVFLIRRFRSKTADDMKKELYPIVAGATASTQVIMGVAILVCAFDASLPSKLGGLTFQLLLSGALLFLVGVIGIRGAWEK